MSAPVFFTIDGSPALEDRLAAVCRAAGEGACAIVPANRLQAMLLGGGYGRGEGGVLHEAGTDHPYNDLEFFVFIKGPVPLSDRQFRAAFDQLGHRLTEEIGIEVEFKIYSLERLQAGETTMFHYDLASGHRVVSRCGSATEAEIQAACAPHLAAERIPLHEAARLMMNRCSGLLYAARRLRAADFGPEDADFTARNLAKLRLALGDILLAGRRQYHWSCRERHRRLMEDSFFAMEAAPEGVSSAQLRAWHEQGVAFKLRPRHSRESREALAAAHRELMAGAWAVWRWLEARRLGRGAGQPADYAADPGSKCPETLALKNTLVRLRAFGPAAWVRDVLKGRAMRYPREALFRTLPVLLWGPDPLPRKDLDWCGSLLHAPVPDWSGGVAAYERLWRRFN
ncbi:MAG: hypothetical protein EOP86_08125 [Verrucomicrobiaceae bacterium]|nr:MAG: hypothetical protein EOP86_08125 [Verrucomicrobiaceae bacterium]